MRTQVRTGEVLDTQSFGDGARRYFKTTGIVQKFYPGVPGVSPAAVDVKPGIHDVRYDTETGKRYSEPWPVMYRVPIRYPSGGGFAIWWQLKVGDQVDLESFDLDPGAFLASGQPSDPAMTRRNGGAHWVAVPGQYADPLALPDPGTQMCIGKPGGAIIGFDGTHVNLGAELTGDFVALAQKVDANFLLVKTLAAALGAGALTVAAGYTAPQSAAVTAACNAISVTPGFLPTGSVVVTCQ